MPILLVFCYLCAKKYKQQGNGKEFKSFEICVSGEATDQQMAGKQLDKDPSIQYPSGVPTGLNQA